MSAGQQFPVLGQTPRTFVPWDFVAEHAQQAERNHGQTVRRLAERGGLCWSELFAVITDAHWSKIDRTLDHRLAVLHMLAEWLARFDKPGR